MSDELDLDALEANVRGRRYWNHHHVELRCNDAEQLIALARRTDACKHIVVTDEGTGYCDLAEATIEQLMAARDAALARCAKLTMALATCVTWMEVGEVRGFQEPIAAARALLADTQEGATDVAH